MKVAIDVASAENPLHEMVHGCIATVNTVPNVHLILVGNGAQIESALAKEKCDASRFTIEHTDSVIGMDESPATAIKEKKNASVMVANRLVAEGKADGCWSPGNTGATLAAALMELGRLSGVYRPAITVPFPQLDKNRFAAFLDLGANADCTPDYLVQFAVMGEAYSKFAWGIEKPRVSLLNIGEEDSKGNVFYKETYEKLKTIPFNFIGNLEPTQIFFDHADVVVADGFTGNIALKAYEGLGKGVMHMIKNGVKRSPVAMLGALLMKNVLKEIKRNMSSDSYGGAPLIGVNGCSMIGHGKSSAAAVRNAVLATIRFVESRVNDHIVENLIRYGCAKGK
ncbi:MAG: phosphate acyltransferase PlsX [Spirochaetota bacterium]